MCLKYEEEVDVTESMKNEKENNKLQIHLMDEPTLANQQEDSLNCDWYLLNTNLGHTFANSFHLKSMNSENTEMFLFSDGSDNALGETIQYPLFVLRVAARETNVENVVNLVSQGKCHSMNLLENSTYSGSAFAYLESKRLEFVVLVVATYNQTD